MSIGRRILKNTFLLFTGQFVILATGIIWTALLARYIGPEVYGIYAYAQSIGAIMAIFVNLGFDQLLIRDVAQKFELSISYLINILFFKFTAAFLIFAGFIVFGYLQKWTGEQVAVMRLVVVTYFVVSMGEVLISVLYAHQAMRYDTLTKILRAVLALGIGLLAIQMKKPLLVILALLFVVSFVPILLNIYFVREVIRKIKLSNLKTNWSLSFTYQLLIKSIPFAALSLIVVLYSNIVILFLKHLTNDDSIIGNFAAAQRICSMLLIVPAMLLHAIFPAFSSVYAESHERFRAMFEQAYRYVFFATAPMSIGMLVISNHAVYLIYGVEYSASISAVKILSLQLLNGVGYVMGPAMIAMGRQTLNTILYGLSLIGVAIICYIVIPKWGTDGACWAIVAGNGVGFVVYASFLFRWLKLPYPWLWMIKTLFASIIMGFIVNILIGYINFLIVSFLIAPIFYFIITRILRTFSQEDKKCFMSLLPARVSRMIPVWIFGGN